MPACESGWCSCCSEGQDAVPLHIAEHHAGFDAFDMATQRGTSHHFRRHPGGTVTYNTNNFRYIWPAGCALVPLLPPTAPGPTPGKTRDR